MDFGHFHESLRNSIEPSEPCQLRGDVLHSSAGGVSVAFEAQGPS
jgi:hypothetical protein